MNGYDAELCSTCSEPAAAVLLEDHGHVLAAACGRHGGRLVEAWTPALFVLEVVRRRQSKADGRTITHPATIAPRPAVASASTKHRPATMY